ncbi:cps25L [Firmicutes bacterium CAG:270]|nr:cps25L [Firmicutes bacterium CAG:270]
MDRKELKEILSADKYVYEKYINNAFRSKILLKITDDHIIKIQKYLRNFRYCQYYKMQVERGNKLAIVGYIWHCKKQNRLGNKLGFYISPSARIGKGFMIYHHGNVIINGNAVIGEFCRLHGNNCIGNSGKSSGAPKIGDKCDVGFGASIIGDVSIASDVSIGAGAVVTKSCRNKGAVLIGIPAEIKRSNSYGKSNY